MFILYCFTAFLSLGLYFITLEIAKEGYDMPMILQSHYLTAWFVITGSIIPFITMFFFIEWYWAILLNIVMFIGSGFLATVYTGTRTNTTTTFFVESNVDIRPPFVVSLISIVLFAILIFS